MIRTSESVIKKEKINAEFDLPGKAKVVVENGQKISEGELIYSVEKQSVIETYYLPKLLGIKAEKARDYLGRVAGEYVNQGDLIAERLTSGGLVTKKLVAGIEGVIGLDRLSKGYLDILSESTTVEFNSPVDGIVKDLVLNKKIVVECEGIGVRYVYSSPMIQQEIEHFKDIGGELVVVGSRKESISKTALDDSYDNKMVFLGKYLNPEIALEVYKRNAKAVIAYSADFFEVNKYEIPIIVLKGFGHIKQDSSILDTFEKSGGQWVRLDSDNGYIDILGQTMTGKLGDDRVGKEVRFKAFPEVGDRVSSIDSEFWGLRGEVIDLDSIDQGFVAVKPESEKSGLLLPADRLTLS
jgi:hypothetical protein